MKNLEERNSEVFEEGVCGTIRRAKNVNMMDTPWSPNDFDEIYNFTGVLLSLKPAFFEKHSKTDLNEMIEDNIVRLDGVKAVWKETYEYYGTFYNYMISDIDDDLIFNLSEKFDLLIEKTLTI